MHNFCTLFNSTYLSRGLALYESLSKNCKDFHLYIFAFDQHCYDILNKLSLDRATIIALNDLEDEKLLAVKSSRTPGEYCWTCTPATIAYCIEIYHLDLCTYIDADLLFFADPTILLEELGDKYSILITEHRYTQAYDQTITSGKYCVQFISFKNDLSGLTALNWWKNACLDWCFNRVEDNKFGDQKYLDDWPQRFKGVKELKNLGGGVAPWNVQQYTFEKTDDHIIGKEIASHKIFSLIFYHFHDFKYGQKNIFLLANTYLLNKNVTELIYRPYITALNNVEEKIKEVSKIPSHETIKIGWYGRSFKRTIKINLFGRYKNYYKKNYLLQNGLYN